MQSIKNLENIIKKHISVMIICMWWQQFWHQIWSYRNSKNDSEQMRMLINMRSTAWFFKNFMIIMFNNQLLIYQFQHINISEILWNKLFRKLNNITKKSSDNLINNYYLNISYLMNKFSHSYLNVIKLKCIWEKINFLIL